MHSQSAGTQPNEANKLRVDQGIDFDNSHAMESQSTGVTTGMSTEASRVEEGDNGGDKVAASNKLRLGGFLRAIVRAIDPNSPPAIKIQSSTLPGDVFVDSFGDMEGIDVEYQAVVTTGLSLEVILRPIILSINFDNLPRAMIRPVNNGWELVLEQRGVRHSFRAEEVHSLLLELENNNTRLQPAYSALLQFFQRHGSSLSSTGQILLDNGTAYLPLLQILAAQGHYGNLALLIANPGSQNRNSTSRQDALPQSSNGPLFGCFPKIPIELRLMIWKEFAKTPRVVALECDHRDHRLGFEECTLTAASPTANASIRFTNTESRDIANEYQDRLMNITGQIDGSPVIYINFHTDTVWLNRMDGDDGVSDCHIVSQLRGLDYNINRQKGRVLRSIAFNCERWHNTLKNAAPVANDSWYPGNWYDHEHPSHQLELVMHHLSKLSVEEVVLVVSGLDVGDSADIVFVDARGTPSQLFPEAFTSINRVLSEEARVDDNATWKDWEEAGMNILREFQARRIAERQEALANGMTQAEIDNEMSLEDVSFWKVKKFRYVDAKRGEEKRKEGER